MKKAIVGKKLGMTQIFLPDGRLVPVTVIQAGPCTVVQKKTIEKDGYEAVQFGFDQIPENRVEKLVNKPDAGHFKKAGVAPMRKLREFRLDDCAAYEIGQVVKADVADEGQALISGRLLADISKSLPAKPVDISSDETRMELVCGSARFTLQTLPVSDYPALPSMPESTGTVPSDAFAQAVAQVVVAAGRAPAARRRPAPRPVVTRAPRAARPCRAGRPASPGPRPPRPSTTRRACTRWPAGRSRPGRAR